VASACAGSMGCFDFAMDCAPRIAWLAQHDKGLFSGRSQKPFLCLLHAWLVAELHVRPTKSRGRDALGTAGRMSALRIRLRQQAEGGQGVAGAYAGFAVANCGRVYRAGERVAGAALLAVTEGVGQIGGFRSKQDR
jgi:hypothetical protein